MRRSVHKVYSYSPTYGHPTYDKPSIWLKFLEENFNSSFYKNVIKILFRNEFSVFGWKYHVLIILQQKDYFFMLLIFFPMARQPLGGLGRLIIEASRSHSDTPHSVGLLCTNDQPVAETSTWQHTTLRREISMPPVGFFFFAYPGFFPFDPFLYCLNPSVLHVTLRSILPSLQQTQH
jgi:hypothetical protein